MADGGPHLRSAAARKSDASDLLSASTVLVDPATDHERWRLKDDRGRQTWHYLTTDEEVKQWPQTAADRFHLGLHMTPLDAARNGLSFFSKLQLEPGNWACEYGGPMFLLPGLIITWYVTETPIPDPIRYEIRRYLFARQHPVDHGWGLHTEGESSVFGTAMNYVVLRLLGVDADDARMIQARACLHALGGAVYGPHWAKFWLSVLGVTDWEIVNPIPPELWLLPDWVPIAPWRWWIHMRQIFLPMSWVWSKRWTYKSTPLTEALKKELFTANYDTIDFASHRNSISPKDNYHPKSWLLNTINWILVHVYNIWFRTDYIRKRGEDWAFELIEWEDENTVYANLGPVNGPMNFLCCYIHDGPDADSVRLHRDRMHDFMWVKNEGMLMNGTNGVQVWDTSFSIQAVVACGLAEDPKYKHMLHSALDFLADQQIQEECRDMDRCYRQRRKGAWGFSTRDQGYTVSDCTSEALKAVLMLQMRGFPQLVSEEKCRDAIDTLLTMQNADGSFSSYEPTRGPEFLEMLNAAEVFGRIMIEYGYPECTTAVVTALKAFADHDPSYRADDIARVRRRAVEWIRGNQRADGSWYGSWAICFTYAGMFALEALRGEGETYASSERVRRACQFFLDRQRDDGGWGESYKSCETGQWVEHPDGSQVVNTCFALLALMEAECPDRAALERGIRLVAGRQQKDGSWLQEGIEGVFNKSCMISYPNYKFIFSIMALGKFAQRYGNPKIL